MLSKRADRNITYKSKKGYILFDLIVKKLISACIKSFSLLSPCKQTF